MTTDAPSDGGLTRRRLLRTGAAVGVALVGAGFFRPGGPPTADDTGSRRGLAVTVAGPPGGVDDSPPTGGADDPTPTGGRAPRGASTRSGAAGDGSDDAGDPPVARRPGESAVVVDAPAVRLGGLVPGSRGRTVVTTTLSGDAADLWLVAAGVDGGENGLTEPERAAGDVDDAGELAAALDVRLSVGGRTLYDGPFAALAAALDGGVRVATCATGRVDVAVDWALPGDVGDAVQTDRATLALRFGATDCGATGPFADG